MSYSDMTREQLIQENLALRSELSVLQGGSAQPASPPVFQHITYTTWPELYCRFSKDFTYTFINEAFTKFLNVKPEEIIGTSILDQLDDTYHGIAMNILLSLGPGNPVLAAEYTWQDINNHTRWRYWNIRAIFDESNSLLEYHATGRDITEQKEAEAQIKHRLNIEHGLAMASKLLIGAGEADIYEVLQIIGKAISVNRVCVFEFYDNLRKIDRTYEWHDDLSILKEDYAKNVDSEAFTWGIKTFLQGGNIIIDDKNQLPLEAAAAKEGMELQGICSALLVPTKGIDKNLLGFISFDSENCRSWNNEDITCLEVLAEMLGAYWERKKMEQAMHASEMKFRTLADTAPAMIFVYSNPDEDATIHYLNNSCQFIKDYNKNECINRRCWDFVHPDFITLAKNRGLARLRGEEVIDRYEIKLLSQNGESCWGDISVSTMEWEGQAAIMGVINDITDRKQMEEELRKTQDELEKRILERTAELILLNEKLQNEIAERQQAEEELILSENRYRAIIEDQNELLIRLLPNGIITFVNDAYCRYFGKKSEDLIGMNALWAISDEDRAIIAELIALDQENSNLTHTLPSVRPDGSVRWYEWTGRAIVKGQQIVEFQAVGRDVSERLLAEETLRKSEANFRKLAETAPALIFVYSQGRLVYVNSALENMTNLTKNELYKVNPIELYHKDYQQQVLKNSIARLNGEKVPPYEVSMLDQNGKQLWGYLYGDTFEYEGRPATLGIIVEITEQKKVDENLLQASKLESLGILAGGIAHDFNNILTVISGNISLAKMLLDEDNELTEVLIEVEKAAFQARDLTHQLLTFSKGGAPIRETATIQELLRDSASFVLRGSNVNCNYAIADNLWPVSIDKGQISQVINNLIINADQAMPEGGSILLAAENVTSNQAALIAPKADNYVKITIKDEGIGIAEEHLSKIFDPYYTTKQKGHGLGLATCYSIIKKHDGEINISSKSAGGTTVNIYLPAFPEQVIEETDMPRLLFPGQGKILIMDDEAVVRETLGKMLQRLGYSAGFAADGLNAVHLYQAARLANEPFDVVLMDLTIAGGMGGKEAVQRILDIDAEAKVIVSSGYSNDPVMAEYKKYGFCGILPKPYDIQAVNKLLYDIITREKASNF